MPCEDVARRQTVGNENSSGVEMAAVKAAQDDYQTAVTATLRGAEMNNCLNFADIENVLDGTVN